jgi:ABC-type antimicrobial peptide transport system permease subunit
MFNQQSNYSDTYEREKIRILQALNVQIQSMAVKLDQIVTQVEENLFKIKPINTNAYKVAPTLISITNNNDDSNNINTQQYKPINTVTISQQMQQQQQQNTNANTVTSTIVLQNHNSIELANNHQLIKIIDEPLNDETSKANRAATRKSRLSFQSNCSSIKMSPNSNNNNNNNNSNDIKPLILINKPPDTTAKRNKQQRQFNTFVRESINQLLGTDFMRTHDVQDIDAQVMEMIRKEAVENYLPDNIRPRRAWHLAKASLRTLKRTLNNKK